MNLSAPPSCLPNSTVSIDLADRSYSIAIGSGLFDNPRVYSELSAAQSALIVTNATVAPLYAQRLQQALQVSRQQRPGEYPCKQFGRR